MSALLAAPTKHQGRSTVRSIFTWSSEQEGTIRVVRMSKIIFDKHDTNCKCFSIPSVLPSPMLCYSRTWSWKTTLLTIKVWSLKTGDLSRQVQLHWNLGPSAKNMCILQDRWSFMAVVTTQDGFHCISGLLIHNYNCKICKKKQPVRKKWSRPQNISAEQRSCKCHVWSTGNRRSAKYSIYTNQTWESLYCSVAVSEDGWLGWVLSGRVSRSYGTYFILTPPVSVVIVITTAQVVAKMGVKSPMQWGVFIRSHSQVPLEEAKQNHF